LLLLVVVVVVVGVVQAGATHELLEKKRETGFVMAFMLLLRLTGRQGLFSELDKTFDDAVVAVGIEDVEDLVPVP
jgi:hypothetical protein